MSKVNEEKILQRPTYTLNSTVVLAYSGLLTAVSILLACIYPIPLFTDFLLYEPSDVPIILGGIFLGLGPGLLITTVTSIIMAIITGHGGPIGIVMHIISTGILVSMITIFYRKGDSKGRYLMGAIIGVLGTTVAMVLWNLILTPLYIGVPRSVVVGLLWPAIIPFNLVKTSINSALAYGLLKLISPHFKR